MQITQNNMPMAPTRAQIRKNSCIHLKYLTLTLVLGLMGFQLRLPYGLLASQHWMRTSGQMQTYTTKYESGCLLNSLASIKGPSCFGLGLGGDQLACDDARGLKPRSVGPENEYLEGLS